MNRNPFTNNLIGATESTDTTTGKPILTSKETLSEMNGING
jgi:hypothetical protein